MFETIITFLNQPAPPGSAYLGILLAVLLVFLYLAIFYQKK
jgi:hypothetical protein